MVLPCGIGLPIAKIIGMPIIHPVTKQDAIDFFKTQIALAEALGINQSSVSEWGTYPPELRQLQIHRITGGRLRAEPDVIAKFGEPRIQQEAA